jgi:hypothetical protein
MLAAPAKRAWNYAKGLERSTDDDTVEIGWRTWDARCNRSPAADQVRLFEDNVRLGLDHGPAAEPETEPDGQTEDVTTISDSLHHFVRTASCHLADV